MRLQQYIHETDNEQTCAHCKSASPMKGKTVCEKCSKELESFRNKASKDKDGGNKG